MILYHGSNLTVSEPRLVEQNRFLDFGFGFYTTTNKQQAIAFAEKVTKRRKTGKKTVSIYEFDEKKAFTECSVLRFDAPDADWLDFVSDNRAGEYAGPKYDFVYGPVADDDVYAEKYGHDEVTASKVFYESKAYELLEQEETKLWHLSPLTLLHMYESEVETGEIAFPEG